MDTIQRDVDLRRGRGRLRTSATRIATRLGDAPVDAERETACLVGYVAHELRSPLATQRALLELALTDPDADTAAWREIAGDVLRACRQQERLLEACLALARSRSGVSRSETVDLRSIVACVVRTRDFGGLTMRSALEWTPVLGDAELIERLADNLISNAIRHNTIDGWIEITTRRSGTNALVTVENSGRQIPADDVPGLFEPFRQRVGERGRAVGGLGLGLSLAKAVADAHQASVAAVARPGGGLRVEVAFPAVEA